MSTQYHQEGVFHAERVGVRTWSVWTEDVTVDQMENVPGVNSITQFEGIYGVHVYVDIRFSEDKVLKRLMELAQRKHKKGECTCDPGPMIFIYHSGDTERMHYRGCPCRPLDEYCAAGPDYVAVKRGDLNDLEKKLNCAQRRIGKHKYHESFSEGWDSLLDAQDLLSDIIVSSMETECI